MAEHAGFAIALTVRESLINDLLLAAYSNGLLRRRLATADFPGGQLLGGPPDIGFNFFLAPIRIACLATDKMRIDLRMWGPLAIAIEEGVFETRNVDARLSLSFKPHFFVSGGSLELIPGSDEIVVTSWTYAPTSSVAFSAEADSYLRSAPFRDRLQLGIRLLLVVGGFALPKIPLRFLQSLPVAFATMAPSRVRAGAVMIVLDLEDDPFVGDVGLLDDFARGNDFAAAISVEGLRTILLKLTKPLLADEGATLRELNLTGETGRFRVSGEASKYGFSATFSFALLPVLLGFKLGKSFQYVDDRPPYVKTRQWPAFGLEVADVDVDAPSLLVSILSLGIANFVVEILGVVDDAESAIADGEIPATIPKVQRFKPRGGAVTTRIEIAETDITASGLYFGIRQSLEALPAALIGVKSIPDDLRGEQLNYLVRLPAGIHADDPTVRIRWTVNNAVNGALLFTEDGVASGRQTLSFIPDILGASLTRLRVGVRVHRTLGPEITDFHNESVVLEIRGPLAAGAYVRWRYQVKNPQVRYDSGLAEYFHAGERVVNRRSKIHRTDRPCAMQAKRSRYAEEEIYDSLPIPLSDLPKRRSALCDYCFYGGPAGLHLAL